MSGVRRRKKPAPSSLFGPEINSLAPQQANSLPPLHEYSSPVTSGATHAALSNRRGLPVQAKVLVADDTTNTGAVVRLVEVQFGDAMRSYKVYRQESLVRPFFRLFSVNDILAMTITLTFFLSCVVSISADHQDHLPEWLQRAAANSDAVHARSQLEKTASMRVRLAVGCVGLAFLAFRFVCAYRRVYVEEVLAIRGVGLQLTTFGVFDQVRERRFIDLKMIRSMVIHDAFFRYQPLFFLSSSIENSPRRLVYFNHTLPRLEVLRKVLVGVRSILYGEEDSGPTLAELEELYGSRNESGETDDDNTSKGEDSGGEDASASLRDIDAHLSAPEDLEECVEGRSGSFPGSSGK